MKSPIPKYTPGLQIDEHAEKTHYRGADQSRAKPSKVKYSHIFRNFHFSILKIMIFSPSNMKIRKRNSLLKWLWWKSYPKIFCIISLLNFFTPYFHWQPSLFYLIFSIAIAFSILLFLFFRINLIKQLFFSFILKLKNYMNKYLKARNARTRTV